MLDITTLAANDRIQHELMVRSREDKTTRNGGLLAAQYEAMQRLMHGERHIYVPA